MKYLFDTNICIYYLKGRYDLKPRIESIPADDRYISEITIAEMIYGAEKSDRREKNLLTAQEYIDKFTTIPIASALRVYAKEKARLSRAGNLIDDFDLLIGATAIANDLILVTRNVSHFQRLEGIKIENWVDDNSPSKRIN
ncbi:MAG TPA: type II toxin-antitoxin system VapC family toxin [Cyclobacteriaceae bacterium]|nr:type II toxin-antitoxin system VapC family toxin [Cyclobacteriaceae bacterium]